MNAKPRIALLPLGRPTFDVAFAEQVLAQSLDTLSALDAELIGPTSLLFDADQARAALETIKPQAPDLLLLLQITFTDASMTVAAAAELNAPVAIWATPEPRSGGRLRLNALCGLNLAAHAMSKRDLPYDSLFACADDPQAIGWLRAVLRQPTRRQDLRSQARPAPAHDGTAQQPHPKLDAALAKLRGAALGKVGQHPEGFDTCAFEPGFLQQKLGLRVDDIALDDLFDQARAQPEERIAALKSETAARLAKLDTLEPEALDKSLRVYAALSDRARQHDYPLLAVRCWPEMFTDYGCAACGAMARLNQDGIPAACEADVDGAISAFILQELAGEPALISDLVDIDRESDSAVLWHCGLAPVSMADPGQPPEATIHSNRQKPLLNQFAFKPGTVTLARLSKAKNQPKLVIGQAEMVNAPRPFSGTCGTLRFNIPVDQVLRQILREGLEHHYAFVYGDVRDGLYALAARLGLPTLALGEA